jgi:hypothetical protein
MHGAEVLLCTASRLVEADPASLSMGTGDYSSEGQAAGA